MAVIEDSFPRMWDWPLACVPNCLNVQLVFQPKHASHACGETDGKLFFVVRMDSPAKRHDTSCGVDFDSTQRLAGLGRQEYANAAFQFAVIGECDIVG